MHAEVEHNLRVVIAILILRRNISITHTGQDKVYNNEALDPRILHIDYRQRRYILVRYQMQCNQVMTHHLQTPARLLLFQWYLS